MIRRLRGKRLGLLSVAMGVAMIAIGVATGRTAHAAATGTTFLIITASDATGGHFPTGSLITQTATVTNSSATSVGDAKPQVDVTYFVSALAYSTAGGGGWTCADLGGGALRCTDGTLTPGGSSTLPFTFSVVGNPGYNADVFYGVGDLTAATNSGSGAQYTYPGSVENPASYTKDAPSSAFVGKVGNDQIDNNATTSQTFTFTDGSNRILVGIPAFAVVFGTHISVYSGNPAFWSGSLSSSSQSFVDGYAVAWTASGTAFNATSSVTMIVSDSALSSGDHLYRATTSGVGTSTASVGSGAWTVSFTEDPGFVAGRTIAATSSGTSGTTTAVIPVVPTTGRTSVSRSAALPLLVGGIFLVLAGTVAIGLRKRSA